MHSSVPGEGGSADPAVLASAMPWECVPRGSGISRDQPGSAGISRAPRAHGKVSRAPPSLPKEGVIYCFQFIVANKFLKPSFPVHSEGDS